MSSHAATDEPQRVYLSGIGGLAGVLGGLAWTVKGTAILIGRDQPPLLFEIGPALFARSLAGLASSTMAPGRRRSIVLGVAALSGITGLAAFLTELMGHLVGAGLAISSVALLVGLTTLERHRRWPAPLAWWLGVAMVPALLLGGALSVIDERLLEVPIVGAGVTWVVVEMSEMRHF